MSETAIDFNTYTIHVFNERTVRVLVYGANSILSDYPKNYPLHYIERRNKLNALNADAKNNRLTPAKIREFGEELFKTLFDSAHQQSFIAEYDKAVGQEKFLLLQLEIDEQILPELAAYPWEFMRVPQHPGKPNIWLSTSGDIAFSRRRFYGRPPVKRRNKERLTVALIISDPTEENLGKVEYQAVLESLRELTSKKTIELIDVIGISSNEGDSATPDKIAQLTRKNPDILHYIGHGRFVTKKTSDDNNDTEMEVGELALVDDITKGVFWVSADYFCTLLSSRTGLVILQACEGGALSNKEAFVGVASTISQQNVPAVVAMQYEISNSTAKRFVEGFYESFVKDYYVDRAVQHGRLKIACGPTMFDRRDFAIPVVFLSVDNGKVFQDDLLVPGPQPDPIRIPEREEDFSPVFMVETQPGESYVERTSLIQELESLILHNDNPSSNTIIISGPGGNGKTTLARELCNKPQIQERFTGGILWIELGRRIESVLYGLRVITSRLKRQAIETIQFSDLQEARDALAEIWLNSMIHNRKILLVVDNAQEKEHLLPFLSGGRNVLRLVTTRSNSLATGIDAKEVKIPEMSDEEAGRLLAQGFSSDISPEIKPRVRNLAQQLGNWPLALKIINSVIKKRVIDHRQPLVEALDEINLAVAKRGVTFFDEKQAISTTINISLDWLRHTGPSGGSDLRRFQELAVFPQNADIPLKAVEKLWRVTAGFEYEDVARVCQVLFELSLIVEFNLDQRYIRLHDVVQEHLVKELSYHDPYELQRLHSEFVGSYNIDDWSIIPTNDTYLWENLFHHLEGAKADQQIIETAKNLNYLASKVLITGPLAVEIDLNLAKRIGSGGSTLNKEKIALETISQGFSQFGHILTNCNYPKDVLATLYSRLQLLSEDLTPPYLFPKYPLPDIPHPALMRTFSPERFLEPVDIENGMYCAINSNGRIVASASEYGEIVVWDAVLGIEKCSFRLDSSIFDNPIGAEPIVKDFATNSKGDSIAIAFGNALVLKDTSTGKTIQTLFHQEGSVDSCDFSRDKALIVTVAGGRAVRIWGFNESGDYEKHRSLELKAGSIRSCTLSPDGNFVLLRMTNSLKLLDTDSLTESQTFFGQTNDIFRDCDLSDNARFVTAALNDGSIKLWKWDKETGANLHTFKAHSGAVLSCTLTRNGEKLISASRDGTIKIWNTEKTEQVIVCEGHTDAVNKCAVSDTGMVVSVSGGEERITKLWHSAVISKESVRSDQQERIRVNSCVISSDEQLVIVVTHQGSVDVIESSSGERKFYLGATGDSFKGCSISQDNKFVISGSLDHRLQIWDIESRTGGNTYFHAAPINSSVLSNDNSFVVSASSDKTLKIWDVWTDDSGRIALSEKFQPLLGHEGFIYSCDISSDNKIIISASSDRRVGIWDAETGKHIKWLTSHEGEVHTCKFSKCCHFIASGSSDKTIKIWDASNYALIKTLSGEHKNKINSCAFSHDGRLLASVSSDQTLKVWDVDSGRCLCAIAVDGALYDCKWFSDNKSIVAVGAGGTYFFQYVEK